MPDTITQKRNSTNAKATLESDNTVTTSIDRPNVTAKVLEAYFAYRNEKKILPDAKKNEIETKYEYALKKVNKGIVSKTLYIVVKTESIIDRNIKISICSAKDKVLTDINIPVKLLYGIDELEEKELLINNYNNDVSIKNKDDFKNQTIFEVTLQPENDDDKKKWIETLSNSTNKKAFLYIKTEVIEENEVIYKGKGKDNKCFLFDNPFELSDICFCDKEMSVQEVKDMVTLLNSGKVKNNLFADRNSKIKIEDRTYEKLTEELNAVFNKYEINTCNRKAHFIAQLYLESARFGTATEYAEGQNYDSKSWENQKDELQLQLTNINTLKSEIDDIMTNLEKTAIEENKPQIKEIELRITSTDTLTEIQEETINTYKSIFEKQWKQNLDNTKTIKYETKKQYEDAVTRAESKISTIKANKNTEEGDGPRYKGKGLIQVTWRDAYEKYFNYIKSVEPVPDTIKDKTVDQILNRKDDDMSQLLATDLFYATDSAGWVWKKFKVLNDKADYDGDSIVSYTINKKTLKIPNIERISRLINGGTEGLQNRTENYNVLKNIFFQVQSACKNSDKIK